MKRLHLFEAIGQVDEDLIEEAADARRTAQPWGKWLAAAACVVLAVSLGTVTAGTLLRGCGSGKGTETADMSAAPSEAPNAAPSEAPSADAAPPVEEDGDSPAGKEYAEDIAEPAAPAPAPASEPEIMESVPEAAEAPSPSGGAAESEWMEAGFRFVSRARDLIFRLLTSLVEYVTVTG